ncbi:hypothetical protein RBS60_11040 [Sinomonas sp. ASV486]|uniref:hypothetical protein n=1 Tax=Sinomonas sp. ASV486 TaxID=3051170 RepID=UPI0027DBC058|nr:hypothetical protein [Sinomonas sp. ASV486]MDQ4490733.1 hypothetical protein [Sinomonas sp. ASV486]
MSTSTNPTPGTRVLSRSFGLGKVESVPAPDAVRVEFDNGHTVVVRARDLWTAEDDLTVAELATVAYRLGVHFSDLVAGLRSQGGDPR